MSCFLKVILSVTDKSAAHCKFCVKIQHILRSPQPACSDQVDSALHLTTSTPVLCCLTCWWRWTFDTLQNQTPFMYVLPVCFTFIIHSSIKTTNCADLNKKKKKWLWERCQEGTLKINVWILPASVRHNSFHVWRPSLFSWLTFFGGIWRQQICDYTHKIHWQPWLNLAAAGCCKISTQTSVFFCVKLVRYRLVFLTVWRSLWNKKSMWETLTISGLCYKCMPIFNINTLSTCVQNTFLYREVNHNESWAVCTLQSYVKMNHEFSCCFDYNTNS